MKKIEVHLKYRSAKTLQLRSEAAFTSIIGHDTSAEELYATVGPVFEQFRDGYDSCILLYGESGSGKTYTALQIEELIFKYLAPHESAHLEIYNNTLTDLTNSTEALRIRERKQQVYVENLTFHEQDEVEMAENAAASRLSAQTALNANSSRSHYLQFFKLTGSPATLILVDLAGSEKPSQSKAEGDTLKEGGEINYSLLVLGRVVNALLQKEHAPFRDSKLTLLLRNAFGGAAVTEVFVCLSAEHEAESENSLQFALRCAGIENKTEKVAQDDGKASPQLAEALRELESENQQLVERLKASDARVADLQAGYEKLKREAECQLLSVMSRAKEREEKLKQEFKMIYWDRQRRVADAEKAHMQEMQERMRVLEADKDYTDLLAFLNLKDDEM